MKNKVILIVGATSMIGRACAHLFAKEGAQLTLLGQDQTKLMDLANELNVPAEIGCINITSESDVNTIIKKTADTYKHIDALVLNVAIYPWKSVEELTLKEWQNTLEVNLTSAFLIVQACFQVMKKQNAGTMVLISSLAGEIIGLPYMSAYSSTKAGLNGFMHTAALEFAPYNITVNSVSPGKIYDPKSLNQTKKDKKIATIPLGRFIEPIDIAQTVKFLISDHAKNITGQNFIVDGRQSVLG
jgi:3-oxoacyl-[acyl-carrier protein] reductase